MAMRLALPHDSFRLTLAPIVIAAICAAFPGIADAGQFIKFTTPKAVGSGVGAATPPNDLQITVTPGSTVKKGTAVLPTGVWPPSGANGNGTPAGATVTFNVAPGSALAVGDVVTGTISLAKAVPNLAVTAASWSYPVPLAPIPITFGRNAVEITKLNVGGGGTGLEGQVAITNETGATEYFSNFLLSYNIPAANFVDTGAGLDNLTLNNLYIGSGVPVSESLTSLSAGATATFTFGLDAVDALDYIAFSFDAYSSPPPSSADYLGSLAYASNAVPEPSSWMLLLLGFAGLAYAGHRVRTGASTAPPRTAFPIARRRSEAFA